MAEQIHAKTARNRRPRLAAPENIPAPAAWLGALGLIPFVGLAAAGPAVEPGDALHIRFLLATYGALILSFLGGVHWGLAITDRRYLPGDRTPVGRLVAGVTPPLVGWAALIVGKPWDLYLLAACFLLLLLFDLRIGGTGGLPAWYPRLRLPLTAIVVAALLFAAISGQPAR